MTSRQCSQQLTVKLWQAPFTDMSSSGQNICRAQHEHTCSHTCLALLHGCMRACLSFIATRSSCISSIGKP